MLHVSARADAAEEKGPAALPEIARNSGAVAAIGRRIVEEIERSRGRSVLGREGARVGRQRRGGGAADEVLALSIVCWRDRQRPKRAKVVLFVEGADNLSHLLNFIVVRLCGSDAEEPHEVDEDVGCVAAAENVSSAPSARHVSHACVLLTARKSCWRRRIRYC